MTSIQMIMRKPWNSPKRMVAISMAICIPSIYSCAHDDMSRPVLEGPMLSFGALFLGERLIPRKDLQLTIIENRESAVIKLASKNWEITGFGVLDSPLDEVYEIAIDDIHGKANSNGSVKKIEIKKLPKQRVVVTLK